MLLISFVLCSGNVVCRLVACVEVSSFSFCGRVVGFCFVEFGLKAWVVLG